MSQAVIVVSGVPRSGTSLVMQMLAAGGHPLLVDDARPADAHNPRGYFEYAPVKALARDASWVSRARGHAVKVIHVLVPHLPAGFDYRLILVRRDLRQVVASQDAMLAAGSGAPPGPEAARLAEIYASQLAELEAWLESREQFRVLRVDHGALLADPTGAATDIAAFVGGGLDPAAMALPVDRALQRQR
ncbi:MAG: sulfotransferase domain-containing protein [Deltaproteobacteria bacterium]|nr:sulfotransferase domain-containing protein [Deltaproteobacteria bacterium]MBW2360065.1 sulfotransferase domain-containing protein [Deltaproteobacteria bacterium]